MLAYPLVKATPSEPRTRRGEKTMERIKEFLKEEDGMTEIEYAQIAAVIALGILLSVEAVRNWIVSNFTALAGITGI
jgi:Flp pilus assembly pilin Flp